MAEESWHAARLIPTSGIGGPDEQERRATSALLAVIPMVKSLERALLQPLGAPSGNVETFIEVPFDLNGNRLYPDGLIRITRGKTSWVALVEVKTQHNALAALQIENYLDIAKEQDFQAVLTISNEIPTHPGAHPTAVDKRKLKKVALKHLSWTEVLTEAVMQKKSRRISDPEQAWILEELIRYLEHQKSGALEFSDMGSHWTEVRDAVHTGTFRQNDQHAQEIANRWDQLVRFTSLKLGKRLGVEVQPVLSRKELADPNARVHSLLSAMSDKGTLEGAVRIPGAIAPISITVDLRAARLTCFLDVDAPKDGKSQTRVNWIIRQLKDAPGDVRVDCFASHARGSSTSELLKELRENPKLLAGDPKREIKSFRIALSASMGSKRGGKGSFVQSVLDLVDKFYVEVVQTVKPWAAQPPKMRPEVSKSELAPPLATSSIDKSSQDGQLSNDGAAVMASSADGNVSVADEEKPSDTMSSSFRQGPPEEP